MYYSSNYLTQAFARLVYQSRGFFLYTVARVSAMAAFDVEQLRVLSTALAYLADHPEFNVTPTPDGHAFIITVSGIINKLISEDHFLQAHLLE